MNYEYQYYCVSSNIFAQVYVMVVALAIIVRNVEKKKNANFSKQGPKVYFSDRLRQ